MTAHAQYPPLWPRDDAGWRGGDPVLATARTRELAHALLEVGAAPGAVVALEHAGGGEALTFAQAALEAGLAVRLGPAQAPFAAALAATPARAAELAALADVDQVAVPVAVAADRGRSLERLAAHGVLQAALDPDGLAQRAAARSDGDIAVIAHDGTAFTRGALAAAVAALQAVGDLLRPGEPVLLALPVDQPWLLALALAASAAGAPVTIGSLGDAPAIRPGVVVGSCADVADLAEPGAAGPRVLAGLARRLGRNRTAPPARCLIVPDGFVDRDLCAALHLSGTAVLHAVGDPHLLVPAALNQPHRRRIDAYGLPVPGHAAEVAAGRLVVHGPAGADAGPDGTATAIGARIDADGFVVPAHA